MVQACGGEVLFYFYFPRCMLIGALQLGLAIQWCAPVYLSHTLSLSAPLSFVCPLSFCIAALGLSICLSVYLSICLTVSLSLCLSVSLSICLSVSLLLILILLRAPSLPPSHLLLLFLLCLRVATRGSNRAHCCASRWGIWKSRTLAHTACSSGGPQLVYNPFFFSFFPRVFLF